MEGVRMDEERFNLEIRKVLKKFGVAAQREIEKAVDAQIERAGLSGDETLDVRIELAVPDAELDFAVDDTIALA
jgi:hypothetical protein